MRIVSTSHAAPRVSTLRLLGLALALAAAAVTAICAAHAGLDAGVAAWRALVSFVSVWAFQFSMAEMWKISAPVAASGAGRPAETLMERSPGSE